MLIELYLTKSSVEQPPPFRLENRDLVRGSEGSVLVLELRTDHRHRSFRFRAHNFSVFDCRLVWLQ